VGLQNLSDEAIIGVEKGKALTLGFGILIHSEKDEKTVDLHTAYRDYLELKKE